MLIVGLAPLALLLGRSSVARVLSVIGSKEVMLWGSHDSGFKKQYRTDTLILQIDDQKGINPKVGSFLFTCFKIESKNGLFFFPS